MLPELVIATEVETADDTRQDPAKQPVYTDLHQVDQPSDGKQ
jgi:hypothetical protein